MRKVFLSLVALLVPFAALQARPGFLYLRFDGTNNYVEIPDSDDFSVNTTEGLTIAACMRPDTLQFRASEGSGYVHWLGKGEFPEQEWVFRMYNLVNAEGRPNRISSYVFNFGSPPQRGIGSFFQEPVTDGEWMHVVGVVDCRRIYIYKNGEFKDCDQYLGHRNRGSVCEEYTRGEWIGTQNGNAPVRLGTRDFASFFEGGLRKVRVWRRVLTQEEIQALYATDEVPQDGLVAEYLFNEDTGEIARDTTGRNDGQIFGATWAREELKGTTACQRP